MNAISPVIATLILIAIAVIAGVFVLRQFLIYSSTTPTQNMIQIQDAVLYVTRKPINNTYYIQVTLYINVKNIGTKIVTVKSITVDKYNVTTTKGTLTFPPITLNPGQTWTASYFVYFVNYKVGTTTYNGTRVPYSPEWDSGSEHIITVYYQVLGQPGIQSVSVKTTVT